MREIKKGSIVGRKSYHKDVLFVVKNIIYTKNGNIAILRGIIERVEADSDINDLEIIQKDDLKEYLNKKNEEIEKKIEKSQKEQENKNYKIGILMKNTRAKEKIVTGKILHLDGDRKYSEKSYRYYKKLGLNAIVKNIPEYKQPRVVYQLLKIYEPDILVVTGHDAILKRGMNYHDIYNYRNSKYFIETVKEARRYDKENGKQLVIFARCLSKLLWGSYFCWCKFCFFTS